MRGRWLTDADVPALLAIFGDAQVMRYWSHGPFVELEDAREYLRKFHQCYRDRSLFQWGMELISTGEIIGVDCDQRRDRCLMREPHTFTQPQRPTLSAPWMALHLARNPVH